MQELIAVWGNLTNEIGDCVQPIPVQVQTDPADPSQNMLFLVSLMGASGSGKSTLLYLIGGLDTIYEGEIAVCGKTISAMKEKEMAALRLETAESPAMRTNSPRMHNQWKHLRRAGASFCRMDSSRADICTKDHRFCMIVHCAAFCKDDIIKIYMNPFAFLLIFWGGLCNEK